MTPDRYNTELYLGSAMRTPEVFVRSPVPREAIHPAYRLLYDGMIRRAVEGLPIDVVSLVSAFRGEKWMPPIADMSEISLASWGETVSIVHGRGSAQELIKQYRRERFVAWAEQAKANANASELDLEGAVSELMQLFDDTQGQGGTYRTLETAAKEWFDAIKKGETEEPRLKFDVFELDLAWKCSCGCLHVIAGRPGMGKTSYVVWLILRALESNVCCLFFSLEMPERQIITKLCRSYMGKAVKAEDEDVVKVFRELPLLISDTPAQTIETIYLKARMAKQARNVGLVVVDYLQLIGTADRHQNREQQVAYISRTLKAMAKDLNCPVIALSQINRQVESRENKRPQLSDLRESGAIEQDADTITFLFRPEYYFESEKKAVPPEICGLCEVILAKQRNEKLANLKAKFEPFVNRFSNWSSDSGCTGNEAGSYAARGMGGSSWEQ